MTENHRAPADSPCELESLMTEAERWIAAVATDGSCAGSAALDMRRIIRAAAAPPGLSDQVKPVRPNEADDGGWRCKQCDQLNAGWATTCGRCNASWQFKNEADAPRGQAVEPRNLFAPGDVVRHRKGGEYVVLFRADYEPTMQDCYVYRGADGHTWVRPALVMEDGRFELIAHAPPASDAPARASLCDALQPNGEADGVREKYRAVTLEDAEKFSEAYSSAFRPLPDRVMIALQAIGAVVPNEVHVPQEGK